MAGSPPAVTTNTNTVATGARRRIGCFLGTILVALVLISSAHASERWETLQAIYWVENPHNLTRPGPCGELGAYQFRERTWRMHTQVPFRQAVDRRQSDAVAVRHYEWICRGLTRAGMPVNPYNVALAWNGGLTATVRGRVSAATRDYAERVNNLALHLAETRVARGER